MSSDDVVRVDSRVEARKPAACAAGGAAGRPTQRIPAIRKSPATNTMAASGPAMRTTAGPSSAKPSAKAAFRVKVKSPFAEVS